MYNQFITFSAGPSHLADRTLEHIHDITSSGFLTVSHRSPEFSEVSKKAIDGLRKQMKLPEDYHIFYQPSSTSGMDTILQNIVDKKTFHFVNGDFSERFYKTAHFLELDATNYETPWSDAVDWQKAVIPKDVELIAITHNETRTGLMWPAEELAKFRKAYPDQLIAIDVTSSFGGMQMDWSSADIWFGSVQKCLGMPPGLGYIIVSPRAFERALSLKKSIPEWHRFDVMAEQMKKYQVFETPNMLAIALLAKQMEDWDLVEIEKETRRKANLIYSADINWKPYIEDPVWQSIVVPHFIVDDAAKWHKTARASGFILGSSFHRFANIGVRVSNFPSHTYEIISRLLDSLKGL